MRVPMQLDLAGRRFLVLGGSRGLGRATAEELVANGARVLIASRSPRAAAEAIGSRAHAVAVDLASPDAPAHVQAAGTDVLDGRLDGVLVNSGGPPAGRALELADEQWRASV